MTPTQPRPQQWLMLVPFAATLLLSAFTATDARAAGKDIRQPALGRRGVRTKQHTLVVDRMPGKDGQILLYDNVADPYQLKNIAADQPTVVDRLTREELTPWLRRTGDPWLEAKGQQE